MKAFIKKRSGSNGGGALVAGSSMPGVARNKSKLPLVVLGVLVLIMVVGGAVWYKHHADKKTATNDLSAQCANMYANGFLEVKGQALVPVGPSKIKPMVDKIKLLKGYDANPNCLYVLTTYYISISDSANARLYYDKLNAVYKPSVGYYSSINLFAKKPSVLKTEVEFVEQQAAALKKNALYGPTVK